MLALLAPAKQAKQSLFSDEPLSIPDFEYPEVVPLTVGKITRLTQQIGARLFEPVDITGSVFYAGMGRVLLAPVAGVSFILSGIPLTSGTITTGKRYKIIDFNAGDNFSNLGATNATGNIFTASGTTPTTWSNGSELQEATVNISHAPTEVEIQAALDTTAWLAAAGGLTVDGSNNFFTYTFLLAGARAQMTLDADNLAPLSIGTFSTLIQGSVDRVEVQSLRISQNPGSYNVLLIASDPASAGVVKVQTGGGGFNAKYRIYLGAKNSGSLVSGAQYTILGFVAGDSFTESGAASNATGVTFTANGTAPTWTNRSCLRRVDAAQPFDGQFSVNVRGIESAMLDFDAVESIVQSTLENISVSSGTIVSGAKYKIVTFVAGDNFSNLGATNVTGNVFTSSGTTPTTWTNGSVLSPVASGNVNVSREAEGQWLFTMQGDMANTDMGIVSADGSALRVIQTVSGDFNTATAANDLMLDSETEIQVVFAIEEFTSSGDSLKLFRYDTILRRSIFNEADTTPPHGDGNYYFGTFARRVPIAGGYRDEVSLDGTTWQIVDTVVAS